MSTSLIKHVQLQVRSSLRHRRNSRFVSRRNFHSSIAAASYFRTPLSTNNDNGNNSNNDVRYTSTKNSTSAAIVEEEEVSWVKVLEGQAQQRRQQQEEQMRRRFGYALNYPQMPFPFPPSDEELHISGLPFLQQISHHASKNRTFLVNDDESKVTYKDILSKSSEVAHFLKRKLMYPNVYSSDTADKGNKHHPNLVAHLTVPGWEYAACQWGAFGGGFASVPLAVHQQTAELEYVLTDSQPNYILVGGGSILPSDEGNNESSAKKATPSPGNANQLLQAALNVGMSDRVIFLKNIWGEWDSRFNDLVYLGAGGTVSTMDKPAMVLYTAGTTGKSKGVVITHRNLYHQVTDLITAWDWTARDIALHVLPLHHTHGVINIFSCAAFSGASIDFQPMNAEMLWDRWANTTLPLDARPNVFMAVPTIYGKLLEAAENLPKEKLEMAVEKSLKPMRLMVSGSAALPIPILERWHNLTGHELLQRYGMTEFAMAISNPYKQNKFQKRQPGHVGLPLPSVDVRLVDEVTGETINENDVTGESLPGELQVKGPGVFSKYLNRPHSTQASFTRDGYFKTGDIAVFNKELNSYRLLGRASVDIIKTGGHRVSALEVECDLLEHPKIAEVSIVAVPDDECGECVGIVCRLKQQQANEEEDENKFLDELREWCSERMPKHKIPSHIRIVDKIPKNDMGNVNKKELLTTFFL